ncbi:MAG: hypothetical protein KIS96_13920 [Bauldia sp.]|nr:hypothetical protein [Bauldia sp.]
MRFRSVIYAAILSLLAFQPAAAGFSDCSGLATTRSFDGDRPVTVTFVNQTGAAIEIVWLNYRYLQEPIGTLQPGQSLVWPTYETNAFMFAADGVCHALFIVERRTSTIEIR